MLKSKNLVAFILLLFVSLSCSSVKNLHFLCEESNTEIYVNGDYLGTGQVVYCVPKDTKIITVECRNDGVVVYQRNYSPESYSNNSLIEIYIPKKFNYKSRNSTEY